MKPNQSFLLKFGFSLLCSFTILIPCTILATTAEDKTIYLIRHGQAEHNLNFSERQRTDEWPRDPKLTYQGVNEALEIDLPRDLDLLVVSPLRRTISTARIIQEKYATQYENEVHTILLPMINEEYKTVSDLGSIPKILKREFPFLLDWDMSEIKDSNKWPFKPMYLVFNPETSNEEEDLSRSLEPRIDNFLEWLNLRPERRIMVVGHDLHISRLIEKIGGNKNFDSGRLVKRMYDQKIIFETKII